MFTNLFSSLPSVHSVLTDPGALFVIPTFQRPYAWENRQFTDLKSDLEKADTTRPSSRQPRHYFAQAHVASISTTAWAGKEDDSLYTFLDMENPDLRIVAEVVNGAAQSGGPNPVPSAYAVVDGQQRLVTLYLLSLLKVVLNPSPYSTWGTQNFLLHLPHPSSPLPRIVLNPVDDHRYFRQIVDCLTKLNPGSITVPDVQSAIDALLPARPAQKRLQAIARELAAFASQPAANAIESQDVKIGLTELDVEFALTSFITLNDRGKDLTNLEKLKALWLDTALRTGQTTHVPNIHRVFGDLYLDADICVEIGLSRVKKVEDAENLIVQLLHHWVDMTNGGHETWYGADKVYEWFAAKSVTATAAALTHWLDAATELHAELKHLCNGYLLPVTSAGIAALPSLHFPRSSTLAWDYQAVLVNLCLPHHFLALFLKFRTLCRQEWHARFPITVRCDPALIRPIHELIVQVKERDQNGSLSDILKRIDGQIPAIQASESGNEDVEQTCTAETSMLEVIERMTVLGWGQNSNPRVGFINTCCVTFAPGIYANPGKFIQQWYSFCNYAGSYDRWYIQWLCQRDAPTTQHYLLYEWERQLGGNLYGKESLLQLEHIMPESWAPPASWKIWGFKNEQDFKDTALQRIGNKALLWEPCNQSVGKSDPNEKATHYTGKTCSGHGTSANAIRMVEQIGKDLASLDAPSPVVRAYFDARRAELATFALNRFFARCITPCR